MSAALEHDPCNTRANFGRVTRIVDEAGWRPIVFEIPGAGTITVMGDYSIDLHEREVTDVELSGSFDDFPVIAKLALTYVPHCTTLMMLLVRLMRFFPPTTTVDFPVLEVATA